MSDDDGLLKVILTTWGPLGTLFACVVLGVVIGIAFCLAEPGTEVRAAFGLVEFTKPKSEYRLEKNLAIDYPGPGSTLFQNRNVIVKGSFSKPLPEGYSFWAIKHDGRKFSISEEAPVVGSDGRWSYNFWVDSIDRVDLHLCMADASGDQWMVNWVNGEPPEYRGFLDRGLKSCKIVTFTTNKAPK